MVASGNDSAPPDYAAELTKKYVLTKSGMSWKLGIKLLDLAAGYAKVEVLITKDMMNIHDAAHGGAIFTLADTAFGLAANTRGPAVGIQLSINYLSSVKNNTFLIATATEEQLTKNTGVYNVSVVDEQENTVSLLRGIVYRKRQ